MSKGRIISTHEGRIMGVKKTSFYKSANSLPELEAVDPNDPDMIAESDGPCCVCDNPSTTACSSESGLSSFGTLAGAQVVSYWLGR